MTVTDHKWLDPNCDENGCQSLVLRESYQELITALAMHSKQMTYAGNAGAGLSAFRLQSIPSA